MVQTVTFFPVAYLLLKGVLEAINPTLEDAAVVLLIPSVTAFLLQKYWVSKKSYVTVSGKPSRTTVKSVSPVMRWVLFAFCSLVSLMVLVFYGIIVVGAFSKAWGYDCNFTLRNFLYGLDVGYETIKDTITYNK